MEGLAPLIIFAVLAIAGVLRKVYEQRREAEEARDRATRRKIRREDLPEATRRLLYGEGTKTAEPRGATPPPVPQGRPRQAVPAIPVSREQAQPRPGPQPQVRPTAQPARPVPRPAPQRPAQPVQRAQQPRPLPQPHQRPQRRPRPQPQRPPQPQAPPPAEAEEPARPARQARRRPARRPGPARPRTAQRPRSARRVKRARPATHALFSGLDDVRRGIVAAEVLGPPKALR